MSGPAQQVAKQGVKKVVQSRWSRSMVTDVGNWPIIGANLAAASFVVIFGGRKLFFHPDVSISPELRFSDSVQNETQTRLTDAAVFREQSKFFARVLYQPTKLIMKAVTGSEVTDDPKQNKWNLTFLKSTDISTPLESTNEFDDGLFEGIDAKPWAKNVV